MGRLLDKVVCLLLEQPGLKDAAWVTIRVARCQPRSHLSSARSPAITLARRPLPGTNAVLGHDLAPLVMPEVITGLSLLLLFVAIGLDRGLWTIVIAHITFTMCYAAVVVQARLQDFDNSVEEAAMDLGATPLNTFFQVTLPIIAPAVVSAWLLAFTLSLDDLVIASFATGPGATTLPMKIYSQVRLGVTPEINAISTILIAIVTVGVLAAAYFTKRQTDRLEPNAAGLSARPGDQNSDFVLHSKVR